MTGRRVGFGGQGTGATNTMKRILIATLNPGKLRDFRGAALSHGINVVPVPNLSALPSVIADRDCRLLKLSRTALLPGFARA